LNKLFIVYLFLLKLKGQLGNDKFLKNFYITLSDIIPINNIIDLNDKKIDLKNYDYYLNLFINFEKFRIEYEGKRIIKVLQDNSHSIALSEENDLLTWYFF
jgi:hypothetical protein